MFTKIFSHPRTRGVDLDSPETTRLRKQVIQEKRFLKKIYQEWYALLLQSANSSSAKGPVLELGSGAGFLSQVAPGVITSDLFYVDGLSILLDGQRLPFKPGSLKAILLTNVLHHIPSPEDFFTEASRCIAPGGVVAMVEPWLTRWSRFVYKHLHHEPVDETIVSWKIHGSGPLSGANTALPWIIFQRDLSRFENTFPELRIKELRVFMPFRYLLSGGISLRSLMFAFTFPFWRGIETLLNPLMDHLGMFAKIVLVRR